MDPLHPVSIQSIQNAIIQGFGNLRQSLRDLPGELSFQFLYGKVGVLRHIVAQGRAGAHLVRPWLCLSGVCKLCLVLPLGLVLFPPGGESGVLRGEGGDNGCADDCLVIKFFAKGQNVVYFVATTEIKQF